MSTELLPNIRSRFCDANNLPLAGGKLYTYEAGTTTPLATYTDQAATTPNANPIVLDGNGEAVIFITSGVQYKFVLTDANDVELWTQDNASGVGFSGNLGTGDVVGPAASVNNEIALFSGTTGKVIKRAAGNGFVKAVAGVINYITGINLATEVSGTLPIANGGTGQTTAQAAIDALLPTQTGQTGKSLKTDGASSYWGADTYTDVIPQVFGSRATPQNVDTNGLTVSNDYYFQIYFVQGNAGPTVVTGNPQISVGNRPGQRLMLILVNGANSITWHDGDGLSLRGGPLVMDVSDQIEEFIWDGSTWLYLG